MSLTYNTLVPMIQQYLQRLDATTLENIPTFIEFAQYKLTEKLDNHLSLVNYVSGSLLVGNGVIAKPAGWRRNLSFRIGTSTNLETSVQLFLRDYEFCSSYWPDRTVLSQPAYYADYAWNNLLIVPTPDIAYPFEYAYIGLPPLLGVNQQQNWFTNYAPHTLLYGSLLEATPYLKDDERIPVWQQFYEDSIAFLKKQDVNRYQDRTSDRGSD